MGKLTLVLRDGDRNVEIFPSIRIAGDVKITGGSGQQKVDFNSDSVVGGDVKIDLGKGVDTANLDEDALFDELSIDFGKGDDVFNDEFNGVYPFDVEIERL